MLKGVKTTLLLFWAGTAGALAGTSATSSQAIPTNQNAANSPALAPGLGPDDVLVRLSDEDGDGLTLVEELIAGTDPTQADTDGDGYTDREELMAGTAPLDPASHPTPRAPSSIPANQRTVQLTRQALNLLRNGDFSAAVKLNRSAGAGSGYFGGAFRWDYQATGGVSGWSAYQGTQIEVWSSQGNQFVELDASKGHLGIKQRLTTLRAGGHLLHWRQCGRGSPQAGKNAYWVAVKDAAGKEIARLDVASTPTTGWSVATLAFTLTEAQAAAGVTINFVPAANTTFGCLIDDISLVAAMLEVDANRDGVISAGEAPAAGKPWRLWINDDTDSGDHQTNDADVPERPMKWYTDDHSSVDQIPSYTTHYNNFTEPGIQGQRDLVDFFPLNLAIAEVLRLLPTTDGYRYRIHQPEFAVNVVLTSLQPKDARLIHTTPNLKAFGPNLDGEVNRAQVLNLDASGNLELPEALLTRIEQTGHGVLLLEGRGGSPSPLELQVTKAGQVVASLPLRIAVDNVTNMFRHIDLTRICTDTAGRNLVTPPGNARPTATSSPKGLPDDESSDQWIVFIHGYNVDCDKAKGWQAETFKRLYALGSKARFVGVTWHGDTGLDYHKAVFHAFQTGDALNASLGFLDIGKTTLMAHSLGNMVASHALQESKAIPHRYLMVNAAVAAEAYGYQNTGQNSEMIEEEWRRLNPRLFASEWYKLPFPAGDRRMMVKWRNRFLSVTQGNYARNCYSGGDEVVICPKSMVNAGLWEVISRWGEGAWKTQELIKGNRSLPALGMSELQGGWGRSGYWTDLSPDQIGTDITSYHLIGAPYFRKFNTDALHYYVGMLHQTDWALDRKNTWYDVLARGIPASTYAAGGISLDIVGIEQLELISGFNLEMKGRGKLWPAQGHATTQTTNRWLHSDFKNVALPYVHPFFSYIIEQSR
jgi:hypothetical protein